MTSSPTFIASSTQQPIAGWLSSSEFHILEVVCETFLPSLEPPPASSKMAAAYYWRSAHDLHIAMHMAELLAAESAEKHAQMHQLLAFFANPVGSLLLVGKLKPFVELDLAVREKYLLAMANSPLSLLRQGYQVLKRLTGFIYYSQPNEQGSNPNWEILDYTLPTSPPLDTSRPIKSLAIQEDTTLACDAVEVGSGAGGGVVAGELALAGKNVIVLEMGDYYSEADYPVRESQAMPALYLQRGLLTSKDQGVLVLAGSTLGGGTVVNWTTSLRAPATVLDEWSQISGLPDFT
jgi:hypothetical protein